MIGDSTKLASIYEITEYHFTTLLWLLCALPSPLSPSLLNLVMVCCPKIYFKWNQDREKMSWYTMRLNNDT